MNAKQITTAYLRDRAIEIIREHGEMPMMRDCLKACSKDPLFYDVKFALRKKFMNGKHTKVGVELMPTACRLVVPGHDETVVIR